MTSWIVKYKYILFNKDTLQYEQHSSRDFIQADTRREAMKYTISRAVAEAKANNCQITNVYDFAIELDLE